MMNSVKRNKELFLLSLLALLFVLPYSFLAWGSSARFVSPDETANYFFAKQFAQKTTLHVPEPLESVGNFLVHPRSVSVSKMDLVPASFTGIIILYGFVAKIFGLWILRYLTPLAAVVAVPFFYLMIKEVFGRRIGLLSALFLLIHPAYWYYAARSMMHNVLFLSLIVVSSYFLSRLLRTQQKKFFLLYGLCVALALMVRASEIFWVALIMLVTFFITSKKKWFAFTCLLTLGAAILFLVGINYYLFHSFVGGGYLPVQTEQTVAAVGSGLIGTFGKIIFPFGFNFQNILNNVLDYFIRIFPWLSIFTIVGLAFKGKNFVSEIFRRKETQDLQAQHLYFFLYCIIFIWLVVYYGSWQLNEYADPDRLILGSSFIRYWLPLFILSLPYCVIGIQKIATFIQNRFLRSVYWLFIIIALVSFSASSVILDPLYGLGKVRKDIEAYQRVNDAVTRETAPGAIIISGLSDKMHFPERRVIIELPNRDEDTRALLQSILPLVPVYLFTTIGTDVDDANAQKIRAAHFQLSPGKEIGSGGMLQRVFP